MGNYLKKQISKVYINRMLLAILIGVFFTFLVVSNLQGGVLKYKRITNGSDIKEELAVDNTKYVEFDNIEVVNTGYTYTENSVPKAKYFVVQLEDRYILAMLPLDVNDATERYSFKGKLRAMDSVDKEAAAGLRDLLVSEDGWTEEEALVTIPSDYIIDVGDATDSLIIFYIEVVILVVLAILAVTNLILAIEPRLSRKYKKLKQYGDIEMVEETVEQDLEDDNKYYDSKQCKIMKNYTVYSTILNLKIFKTDEIMWMYKMIIQNRYGFIPIGKTYELDIKCSNKALIRVTMKKEAMVDEVISSLESKLPNVIYGFPEELAGKADNFDKLKEYWEEYKKGNN